MGRGHTRMQWIDGDEEVVRRVVKRAKFGIGYHRCHRCWEPTPKPSQAELERQAADRPRGGYVWPFTDWWPDGWMTLHNQQQSHYLCPKCVSRAIEEP